MSRAPGMFFFHCNVYFFNTNVCLIVEYSYKWQHPPQKGVSYLNERGAQDTTRLEPGYAINVFFFTLLYLFRTEYAYN